MIDIERDGSSEIIKFKRPTALNADGLEALETALSEIAKSNARVLILTGSGDRAFWVGADIKELANRTSQQVWADARRGQAIGKN